MKRHFGSFLYCFFVGIVFLPFVRSSITSYFFSSSPNTVGSTSATLSIQLLHNAPISGAVDVIIKSNTKDIVNYFSGTLTATPTGYDSITIDATANTVTIKYSSSPYATNLWTITVNPFTNPSSTCDHKFTITTSGSAIGTLNAIAGTLSSFSVTPSPLSKVAGYAPVTFTLSPSSSIPTGGIIKFNDVTLKNSPSDCTSLVSFSSFVSTFTCSYSSPTITITISSFSGTTTKITSSDSLAVTISDVLYNTKMSAQSVTVSTLESASCDIESSTNSNQWIPTNPASFQTKTLAISMSTETCSPTALSITIQPTISITTSQIVVIQFSSEVYAVPGPSSFQFTVSSYTTNSVTGILKSKLDDTNTVTIIMYYFVLPHTTIPFSCTITTYSGTSITPADIVHRDTTSTASATSNSTSTTNTITLSGIATVSEAGTYTAAIAVTCYLTTTSEFVVTIPSDLTATSALCTGADCTLNNAQQMTIKNAVTTKVNGGNTFSLSFRVLNPPSIKPVTDSFTILVKDSSYSSVTYTTTLVGGTSYSYGSFTSFTVVPTSAKCYSTTSYVLTITVNHRLPSGTELQFTFPADVKYSAATLSSMTIDGTAVTSGSFTASTLTLSGYITSEVASGKSIVITLAGIVNPGMINTYPGFAAKASLSTFTIDYSSGQSISITQAAEATIGIALGSYINAVSTTYTITFSSPLFTLPYGTNDNYLKINVPSDVQSCDPDTLAVTSPSTVSISNKVYGNPFSFKFSFTSPTSQIIFTLTCTNPLSGKPSGVFAFTYYSHGTTDSTILTGEQSVTTTIGRPLTVVTSVSNNPTFPGYSTVSTITISRTDVSIPIKRITIGVTNYNTGILGTTDPPVTSTCTSDGSNMVLEIASAITTQQITIRNIGSTNPTTIAAATSSAAFTVKTFSYVNSNYYIVDQVDDAGRLSVSCNTPCKTCTSSLLPDECQSCVDLGTKYYYFSDTHVCKQDDGTTTLCGNGYYRNSTRYTCDKCDSSCATCISTSATYCDTCTNTNYVIYNGACISACYDGYYTPAGSKICTNCISPCDKCQAPGTFCLSCIPEKYLKNSQCLSDCGEQHFKNSSSMKCDLCDATKCYNCSGTATKCTGCLNSYLLNSECVTESSCTTGSTHIANTATYTCDSCNSSCATCSGTINTCTSCSGTLNLYGSYCMLNCPAQHFALSNACSPCSNTCDGCVGSATHCTSCQTGYKLVVDTYECVLSCTSKYYLSGNICYLCNTNCLTCQGSSTTCTSCNTGYLYNYACITVCPPGTFVDNTNCTDCDTNCVTCSGSKTHCTSCSANMLMYSNSCVSTCPPGTTAISGNCEYCTGQCASCSGIVSYCTSCLNTVEYAYGGTCLTVCPSTTIASKTSKVCVPCTTGCDVCSWSSSVTTDTSQACTKCTSGYKFLSDTCYYVCPTGYTTSSDGLSCVSSGTTGTPSSSSSSSSSSFQLYVPPHIITAMFFIILSISSVVINKLASVSGNIACLVSYTCLTSYLQQIILSMSEGESFLMLVTGGIVGIHFILNFLFWIPYKSKISSDVGFLQWAENHSCTKTWIVSLATVLSFQSDRLFYSRLFGFDLFYASFRDFWNLFTPLNLFSVLAIVLIYLPIIGVDCYFLFNIEKDIWLYSVIIESFILSLIMIITILIIISQAKKQITQFKKSSDYSSMPNDPSLIEGLNNSKQFDEEDFRRRILDEVLSRLGISKSEAAKSEFTDSAAGRSMIFRGGKRRPRRRRSMPNKSQTSKTKDGRKTHSYPSSPKTAKEKEVPLKQYGINEEPAEVNPELLPNNVYSEAKPPKDPNSIHVRPMKDFAQQTPPFEKIAAFKKHLQTQDKKKQRKKKKLFEMDPHADRNASPLEVIEELPEEKEDYPSAFEVNKPPLNDPADPLNKKEGSNMITEEEKEFGKDSFKDKNSSDMKVDDVPTEHLNSQPDKLNNNSENSLLEGNGPAKSGALGGINTDTAANGSAGGINPSAAPANNDLGLLVIPNSGGDAKGPNEEKKEEKKSSKKEDKNASKKEQKKSNKKKNESKKSSKKIEIKKEGQQPFESSLAGQGESSGIPDPDKVQALQAQRNVFSPPQKAEENPDVILSAPLDPVGEYDKPKTGEYDSDLDRKKVLVTPTPNQEAAKNMEEKKDEPPMKTLADQQKTPDIFEENDGFQFSITNLKSENDPKPQVKPEVKKLPQEIKKISEDNSMKTINTEKLEESPDIEDIDLMGSFEKDPIDDCILIRENAEGQLMDLRGRRVNRHGYLIDEAGNIIDRNGKIIFTVEEIPPEFRDIVSKPMPIKNSLFREDEKSPSKKETPVEEFHPDEDNRSRKSVSVDSLMGDTPSNYNIQNQRFDDPLDHQRKKNAKSQAVKPLPIKRKEIEYEPPREEDKKMAGAYGGPARGPPKRPKRKNNKLKSTSKREDEQMFQPANKTPGYFSDAEQKIEGIRGDQLAKQEERKSKPTSGLSNRGKGDTSKISPKEEEKNNEELEKIYGENLEDMFLYSDGDDSMSIASIAPSNVSRASNKNLMPKLKGLESIYLQRLESSAKHKQSVAKRKQAQRIGKSKIDTSKVQGSESERDEISSLLSENYAAMQNQFHRGPDKGDEFKPTEKKLSKLN